ncbi:MAG: LPXTG cell wall anchor domain-containing protein [Bacteroidota bacterium]|nr:LPXTG cell wall anchor domain-containing protein [Bacteroidota bacterium]
MRKSILMGLLSLFFMGGMNKSFAQSDSAKIAEEPTDTISIDNMDPVFYEEEDTKEDSNTMTYALIGGIVVIGGAAFYFIRKKKK